MVAEREKVRWSRGRFWFLFGRGEVSGYLGEGLKELWFFVVKVFL